MTPRRRCGIHKRLKETAGFGRKQSGDNMIKVVGVTHQYSFKRVLSDVNIAIAPGELLALMGANGVGKSTLLSIMGGLLTPMKGYVEIDGMRRRLDPDKELAIRRKAFYLPAELWLPTSVSCMEYLMAVGRLYQDDEERLYNHAGLLLNLFNLESKRESLCRSCSTGQKKKIALAAALITETPVLLLDEPFSGGLDPAGITVMEKILRWLSTREDRTIVISTPVPELVEGLAHRIAVMREETIEAVGTVEELRRQYDVIGSFQELIGTVSDPEAQKAVEAYMAEMG